MVYHEIAREAGLTSLQYRQATLTMYMKIPIHNKPRKMHGYIFIKIVTSFQRWNMVTKWLLIWQNNNLLKTKAISINSKVMLLW